jgi:hypothetical protein
MSETELVSSILQALALEPGVVVWRNNTGQARLHGSHVKFGLGIGSADIIGLVRPTGRFIALECKTEKGRASFAQFAWRNVVEENGGIYGLVRSVEEARDVVRLARR